MILVPIGWVQADEIYELDILYTRYVSSYQYKLNIYYYFYFNLYDSYNLNSHLNLYVAVEYLKLLIIVIYRIFYFKF